MRFSSHGLTNMLSLADCIPSACLLLWAFSSELPENMSFSFVSRNMTFYSCFFRIKYLIYWLVLPANSETGSRYWGLGKIHMVCKLDPQILLVALQPQG